MGINNAAMQRTALFVSLVVVASAMHLPDVDNVDTAEISAVEEGETVGVAVGVEGEFQSFMREHGKVYDTDEEYKKRLAIFGESKRFVEDWNANPKSKFRVKINQFADLSGDEFAEQHLIVQGLEGKPNAENSLSDRVSEFVEDDAGRSFGVGESDSEELRSGMMHVNSGETLPKHVDWATHGRTGAVYKQGICAACYTFATNAAIEGTYFIETGKRMPELSDQEILSCSRPFGNHGCIGGNMEKSYHYILSAQESNGGMTLAKNYPYEGSETPCKADDFKPKNIRLAGYRKIRKGSERDLLDAVAQRPVAIGIDAHHPAFKLYSDGVFDIDYCTSHLTHAVLIVGYGTSKDGKDYWLLQNSWGKHWGEEGWGKIARGKNMCALSNLASYPVLDKPETWTF